jgi:hypothetical protein
MWLIINNIPKNLSMEPLLGGYLHDRPSFLLDQIDTLNIKGKLIDAKTLEPKKNTWVFLHKESLIDSLGY